MFKAKLLTFSISFFQDGIYSFAQEMFRTALSTGLWSTMDDLQPWVWLNRSAMLNNRQRWYYILWQMTGSLPHVFWLDRSWPCFLFGNKSAVISSSFDARLYVVEVCEFVGADVTPIIIRPLLDMQIPSKHLPFPSFLS